VNYRSKSFLFLKPQLPWVLKLYWWYTTHKSLLNYPCKIIHQSCSKLSLVW
jgi:hypothetical protein